jgi:hypothetical protein
MKHQQENIKDFPTLNLYINKIPAKESAAFTECKRELKERKKIISNTN